MTPSAEPAVAIPRDPTTDPELAALEFDWDDSLPIYGALPSLLPVGCNAYIGGKGVTEQYVWLRFDPDYLDVDPGRADNRWIGRREDYFDRILAEVGWELILDTNLGPTWIDFLLTAGIAPGQPFLVHVRYSAQQNYWGEWNEDWDAEVVALAPWSAQRVRRAWDRALPLEEVPRIQPPPAYLRCPACEADALPSSVFGCAGCSAPESDHDHACVLEPLWDESDDGRCPACGSSLRVVVGSFGAYVEVREP